MLQLKQHFIFDLDGTLWDAIHPCVVGWNKALSELEHRDLQITNADLISMVGHSQLQIFAKLFPEIKGNDIEDLRELCDKYQAEAIREIGGQCYPNTIETLLELQQLGKQIYIVSNCESGYIELFLNQTKLEIVLDFECWGNTGNPKFENINSLIERNDLSKVDCVYIGDTQGDCDAAAKAEVDFVYANYGFGKISATPSQHEIKAMQDLLPLVSMVDQMMGDER